MNITKENIDHLNAVVTIQVAPADYEKQVEDAVKKAQRNIAIPGFRAGKVPAGMVKKMYGKSILAEEINKILNKNLHEYITENNIEILGNPLPKADENKTWENGSNFTFQYDLGLAPAFTVDVFKSTPFPYETVQVDDKIVEKYMADIRRNFGKPVTPDVASEKDVVFVDINELDETGSIKAGGVYKSTSIGIERLKSEAAQKKLIGAKKEDKIVIKANELYEDAIDRSVSLGIDKEMAASFTAPLQLSVKNIARMEDAELNEELFTKMYPDGSIKTEEELRNKVKAELALMFEQDSDRKFMSEAEKILIDSINPALPEDFLKRWLMAVNEKPVTMEQLNAEFDSWARSMKWKLIENKIIKANNITVTTDEATEEARRVVRNHFARYGQNPSEEEIEKNVKSILRKEKEVDQLYENLYRGKVLNLFKTTGQLAKKEVSYNEFFGVKE
ncbi:MAG: trigger factor [Bacteroidetes bacterium]|nr:trigger factor [Bacteroidota bacterium]